MKSLLANREMRNFPIILLMAAAFVLLGRSPHAQEELQIDLVERLVNSESPTEQNNIVTLACSRSNHGFALAHQHASLLREGPAH